MSGQHPVFPIVITPKTKRSQIKSQINIISNRSNAAVPTPGLLLPLVDPSAVHHKVEDAAGFGALDLDGVSY